MGNVNGLNILFHPIFYKINITTLYLIILASCSHVRAWKYYIESIQNPYGFPSVSCHSCDAFKSGKCLRDSKNSNGQIVQYMGIAANEK